jgi:putative peptidoglycan lipid II flippase
MSSTSVGHSVARAAGLIAVATLLARVAGFVRTLVFSHSAGTTGVGDVYQTVNTLPNVVYEVAAGGVLAAVAVPLVAGQLGAGRPRDADRIASALLGWAVAVLLPASVLLALLAPWLSRLLLGGHATAAEVDLGSHMLVLFAPQVLLYGVGIVLSGVLQAHRRFLAAALAPLLSSLVVIASYLAYAGLAGSSSSPAQVPDAAVWALAGGTTLGVVVLSLPLLVPVLRAGVSLRPTLTFPPGVARRAGSLAGAGVLALAAQQAAVFVTLWLTHHRTHDVGTVNVYSYVQAVYLLPYAVLAVPIAMSAFPALAHSAAAGGEAAEATTGTVARSLQGILLLTAGAAAVLVAVAGPVGDFFTTLDAGAHSGGGDALTALPAALAAYAPGLVGFSVAALLTRALYVRGRPLYAALAVAGGWAVAALLPLVLLSEGSTAAQTLGSLGVGSSVGMLLSGAALALLVRRAWGPAVLHGCGRTLGAAVVAVAVAMGIGDTMAHGLRSDSLWGALAGGVAVAVLTTGVYLGVMMVADRGSMRAVLERGRRRRRGSRGSRGSREGAA